MAAKIPYKYYRDIRDGHVEMMPGTNTPSGFEPISFDEFVASAKGQFMDNSYGKGVSYLDYIKNTTPERLVPDADSGLTTWTDPSSGRTEFIQKRVLDQMERDKNDPALTNIGTAEKPMYVPKGSAGEAHAKAGFPNTASNGAPQTVASTPTQVSPGTAGAIESSQVQAPTAPQTQGNPTGTASTQASTVPTTGTPSSLSNEQMRANLAAILPANVISTIPDNQLAAFSAIADSFKQQYSQGTVNADIQAKDLQDAIDSVANDVEFKAKYGDNLALATADFQNTLKDYQYQTGQMQTQQQKQLEDQQKGLAEQHAAAGTAMSGFREAAKQRLSADQGGIIESTRQQLKKNLTNLGQSWEAQFGSAAAQTPSIDYVNPLTGQMEKQQYNPLGNIYGQIPLAKKQEQESLGAQRYNAVKLPI